MNPRYSAVVATAAMALAGCATSGASPEKAALQARNPRLKVQWVSPDTRVPPFDRVMLAPMELDFRPVAPLTGPTGTPQTRTEFPVPERDRQRIAEDFAKIFRDELGDNSHYTITDRPGPGVLLVKPALRDIVSRVPPEEPPGRSDVYVDNVGDATLVVDLVDAASGQKLGSASDRRTAEPAGALSGFGGVRADRVATGQEVRRLARRWATSLEKRLDQLYFEAKPR